MQRAKFVPGVTPLTSVEFNLVELFRCRLPALHFSSLAKS